MDTVTDAGKGAAVFINEGAEAWKIFNQNFVNTMAVAARDVQVELEMPPGFEITKFSGEEFGENPDEIEPQHLAPNDSMVFHQHVETCAPDLVDDTAEFTIRVVYKDAVTFEEKEIERSYNFFALLGQNPDLLPKGAAIMAYADGLDAYKQSGDLGDLGDATTKVQQALALAPNDADLQEIKEVLDLLLD